MISNDTGVRLSEVAHDLFKVMTQISLATPRGRRRLGDLKDIEFLTLAILHQHQTMIVGDIQRQLGVLPAQMSRIIRSLENRDRPCIHCRINPQDKRKIDVCLTAAGERALNDYQTRRIENLSELLRRLGEEEQEDLGRLIDKLQLALERSSHAYCASEGE